MKAWEFLASEKTKHAELITISPDLKTLTFKTPNDEFFERKVADLSPKDLELAKQLQPVYFSDDLAKKADREGKVAQLLPAVNFGMTVEDGVLMRMLGNGTAQNAAEFAIEESKANKDRGNGVVAYNVFTGTKNHSAKITQIASCNVGSRLASLSEDGTVLVWDLLNQKLGLEKKLTGANADTRLLIDSDGITAYVYGNDGPIQRFDLVTGEDAEPMKVEWAKTTHFAHSNVGTVWVAMDSNRTAHVLSPEGEQVASIDLAGMLTTVDALVVSPHGTEPPITNQRKKDPMFIVGSKADKKFVLVSIDADNKLTTQEWSNIDGWTEVDLGSSTLAVSFSDRVILANLPGIAAGNQAGLAGRTIPTHASRVSSMKLVDSDHRLLIMGSDGIVDSHWDDFPEDYASGLINSGSSTVTTTHLTEAGEVACTGSEDGSVRFARPDLQYVAPRMVLQRIFINKLNGKSGLFVEQMLEFFSKTGGSFCWATDADLLTESISMLANINPSFDSPAAYRGKIETFVKEVEGKPFAKLVAGLYYARLAVAAKVNKLPPGIEGVDAAALSKQAMDLVKPVADGESPPAIALIALLEAGVAVDMPLAEQRPYLQKLLSNPANNIRGAARLGQLLQPPYRAEAVPVAKFAQSAAGLVAAEDADRVYAGIIALVLAGRTIDELKAVEGIDFAKLKAGIAASDKEGKRFTYAAYDSLSRIAWAKDDKELAKVTRDLNKPLELRWTNPVWSNATEVESFVRWTNE